MKPHGLYLTIHTSKGTEEIFAPLNEQEYVKSLNDLLSRAVTILNETH